MFIRKEIKKICDSFNEGTNWEIDVINESIRHKKTNLEITILGNDYVRTRPTLYLNFREKALLRKTIKKCCNEIHAKKRKKSLSDIFKKINSEDF